MIEQMHTDLAIIKIGLLAMDKRIAQGKVTDPEIIALQGMMTLLTSLVESMPRMIAHELRKLQMQ